MAHTFKVGDRVRLIERCSSSCGTPGDEGIMENNGLVRYQNGSNKGLTCASRSLSNWELISSASVTEPMSTFREVPEEFEKHADADSIALYKAGIISDNFKIYSEQAFREALLRLNYKALAEQARADIKEEEFKKTGWEKGKTK